jgi:hypothetical protein
LEGQDEPLARAECRVDPLGRRIVTMDFQAPVKTGYYTLIAELTDGGETIQSLRDCEVTDASSGDPGP